MQLISCALVSARNFFLRPKSTGISSMALKKTSATSTTTMNASVRELPSPTALSQVARDQLRRDHLCLVLTLVNQKTSLRELGLPLHLRRSQTTSQLVVKEELLVLLISCALVSVRNFSLRPMCTRISSMESRTTSATLTTTMNVCARVLLSLMVLYQKVQRSHLEESSLPSNPLLRFQRLKLIPHLQRKRKREKAGGLVPGIGQRKRLARQRTGLSTKSTANKRKKLLHRPRKLQPRRQRQQKEKLSLLEEEKSQGQQTSCAPVNARNFSQSGRKHTNLPFPSSKTSVTRTTTTSASARAHPSLMVPSLSE